jgi:hypothetical protein
MSNLRIPPSVPLDSRDVQQQDEILSIPDNVPSAERTQKHETLDALKRFNARSQASVSQRPRSGIPGQTPRSEASYPKTVPVHVREESKKGDGIIVTLREGHWIEKPKQSKSRIQLGLHTGMTIDEFINDVHEQAGLLDSLEIDGQTIRRTDSAQTHTNVLASCLRSLQKSSSTKVQQNTDPRTPEGAAWLRGEWAKVNERVSDPAARPRKEVIDWIISGEFPEKASRTGQDTYWEHIFLRYCGGDFLPLDLERNYSKDLRWAYIGEWNATGKGHPAINTSATLLNDKLAGTGYDVYETKFVPVGDRLCVTELWGYRDAEIKNNQVTDGVDTFWIANGEITHKMISLTVTDADGDKREYYRKIGQPVPGNVPPEQDNSVD